jgi:hypothetical protein
MNETAEHGKRQPNDTFPAERLSLREKIEGRVDAMSIVAWAGWVDSRWLSK